MNKASTVARGAAIIAIGTLVSRLLGLIRENLISHYYGTSIFNGAFRAAYSVPDLLYYLLAGGALSAAFIPVFSDYLLRDEQEEANRVGSSIANLMLLCLTVGVALEIIFAPYVVRFVAPGINPLINPAGFALTVTLTRVLCGIVLFTAISGLYTGMLNAYHHFLMPTVVWNVFNIIFIIGIAVLRKLHWHSGHLGMLHWHAGQLGIYGVCVGALLGALSMVLLQIPVVMKYGYRYTPVLDLANAGVRRVIGLFGPVMLGLSLSYLNLQFIPIQIASLASTVSNPDAGLAAVVMIVAANRVVLLPLGIFAIAIATAAFPRLSQQATLGEVEQFRATFQRSLTAIILLVLPASVGIYVLARPMIGLLNGGGAFDVHAIDGAAFALMLFSWGLLALSMLQLVYRAFFARKEVFTPVLIGLLMVASNVAFGWYLTKHTRVYFGGTALATSVTTTLATFVLLELLRRRLQGFGGRELTITTLKIVLASVVMGFVVYLIAHRLAPTLLFDGSKMVLSPTLLPHFTAPPIEATHQVLGVLKLKVSMLQVLLRDLHVLIQIGASMIAGLAVYFAMLRLLGVREIALVTARFRRRPTVSA